MAEEETGCVQLLETGINCKPSYSGQQLTHALTDLLRLVLAVHPVVVEAHVEGVTLVLVPHPVGRTVALRAVIGRQRSLKFGFWFVQTQKQGERWRRSGASVMLISHLKPFFSEEKRSRCI